MKKLYIFFISFILNASMLFGEPLLSPSTANLEVKAGKFTLNMDVSLFEKNGIWVVSSKVSGIAKREEKETFLLEGKNIKPLEYSRKQKILFKKNQSKAIFNWDASSLIFNENKNKGNLQLEKSVLGPSTATLKLRIDIKRFGLENLPETVKYKVYYNKKIKERIYKFGEIEEIETPMGKLRALKVSRIFLEGEDRKQIYWLSPEFDFSIVKIIDENKERKSDIRIKSINNLKS